MATVGADVRQRIIEISALLDTNRMVDANDLLSSLISESPSDVVSLISPDLKLLIDRFYKQKKRSLTQLLEFRLKNPGTVSNLSGVRVFPDQNIVLQPSLRQQYNKLLQDLANRHIFQWANHYRDALHFIFTNTAEKLSESKQWHESIADIGIEFSDHAQEIFSRGFSYQQTRGLAAELSEIKALSGLQNFLYYVIVIFAEQRESAASARSAQLLWSLASSVLTGILRGFGRAEFGERNGVVLLERSLRMWLAPLGFCRGSDVIALIDEFDNLKKNRNLYVTVVPSLLAIENTSNRFHGDEIFLPRLCRVSVFEPARLDITLSIRHNGSSQEIFISSFFNDIIQSELPITDVLALRADALVLQLGDELKGWQGDERERVLDARDVKLDSHSVHEFSELIHAQLNKRITANYSSNDPTLMGRNYASEFPLDDPDFRRQFFVERNSVKQLLQQIEGTNGIHLWCSVRRSGKTTAANSLADPNGRSIVVMQSMDHLSKQQLEQNIFKRKLREALNANKEIEEDFFDDVVSECVLAATNSEASGRRIVLILDEYETLFGLIEAYVKDDIGLKFKVALPLLSQMVGFATKNLLIFMGQRPDAYQILSAQNQLSPLVRQYNFPLFAHINGAVDTEFTQLLRRILTEKLPFDPSFSDRVYDETSGHPYLTVNLMVDFCDWLMANDHRLNGEILESTHFLSFSRDRLVSAKLKRSPRYEFFNHMLAEYLSESGRVNEPWLSAITSILQEIAKKHPSAFACPVNSFEALASPYGSATRMTPSRLLASGSLANFLQDKDGRVKPGVRLLARLAGSTAPSIN